MSVFIMTKLMKSEISLTMIAVRPAGKRKESANFSFLRVSMSRARESAVLAKE
jgi:hypothetical protein